MARGLERMARVLAERGGAQRSEPYSAGWSGRALQPTLQLADAARPHARHEDLAAVIRTDGPEGVLAKRSSAPYREGRRAPGAWRKLNIAAWKH